MAPTPPGWPLVAVSVDSQLFLIFVTPWPAPACRGYDCCCHLCLQWFGARAEGFLNARACNGIRLLFRFSLMRPPLSYRQVHAVSKVKTIVDLLFQDLGKVPHIEIMAAKPLRDLMDFFRSPVRGVLFFLLPAPVWQGCWRGCRSSMCPAISHHRALFCPPPKCPSGPLSIRLSL